jgi:RNA polymerase sigma factor (sigma-70 family)
MQAYLRQSVINRIRDEMRRLGRRPVAVELPADVASDDPSPLDLALKEETYERYRTALNGLKPRERELVISRLEAQWSIAEIAEHFAFRSVDAARMAVSRAVQRLGSLMNQES